MKKLLLAIALCGFLTCGVAQAAISFDTSMEMLEKDKSKDKKKKKKKKCDKPCSKKEMKKCKKDKKSCKMKEKSES